MTFLLFLIQGRNQIAHVFADFYCVCFKDYDLDSIIEACQDGGEI